MEEKEVYVFEFTGRQAEVLLSMTHPNCIEIGAQYSSQEVTDIYNEIAAGLADGGFIGSHIRPTEIKQHSFAAPLTSQTL